jgi:hypothetical protein
VAGGVAMLGFLLSGVDRRVDVLVFLILFVFLQFIFSILSGWVMFRTMRGNRPVMLPVNPVKYALLRVFPDKKFFRECWSVIRLLLLRYSQEAGALFTIGALVTILFTPPIKDFDYVWESDDDEFKENVEKMVEVLAAPWISTYSDINVSEETIENSRQRPNSKVTGDNSEWRPFLVMAMVCYALAPRLLMWVLSKVCYARSIRSAISWSPGAQGILTRMKSPVVSTQAVGAGAVEAAENPVIEQDKDIMLVNWAGALESAGSPNFDELKVVPEENILDIGLGSLENEARHNKMISDFSPSVLLIAVKAWEPPMADLRDFLSELEGVRCCTLYLLPLPGRLLSESAIEDWNSFSRRVSIDQINVISLGSWILCPHQHLLL